MRSAALIAVTVLTLLSVERPSGEQEPAEGPEPGVAASLARERAQRISDLRYDLAFTIPGAREAPIAGRATLTFVLAAAGPLALVFAPGGSTPGALRLDVNGVSLRLTPRRGHIVVPASALAVGANRVTIDFQAGDVPLNRG